MDYIDIAAICADISSVIDELKHLASTGELTEERLEAYSDLNSSIEDFVEAYNYHT